MMTPRCHCAEPAVARLVFIWADGAEGNRTKPLCRVHYEQELAFWSRFRELAPDVLADLNISAVGP